MRARGIRFVVFLALVAATCAKKELPAPPPKPVAISRPRPLAPDAAQPAARDSCAGAVRALTPDADGRKGRVVLVLFWAVWSAPDRVLIKSVESEIARDADRWHLVKVDIDAQPDVAKACDIRSVPTLIAFARGRPASQIVGAVPAARVRQFLEAISGSTPNASAGSRD